MLPLDGYIRVSKVGGREGEGFISPDVQEKAIRAWSEKTGREVVMQRPELDRSGGTMDRPIFNEVMERVRAGKAGGVVVYKHDRFARTLLGGVQTLAELGEHDAVFASVSEPALDYSTPSGRAFMQQMFVFAEFMRSTAKEGWATAQTHATERGIHISPVDYLGYSKANRRLVPNGQAPVVVEAFRRRAQGESWTSLADWLNEAAPKPDGQQWTGSAVQRLCAKRVYLGEASRYVNQDVDGRGPVVNRGAHPALVTEEQWRAAQMDPRMAPATRTGKPPPLLSGLIRCAGCRYALSVGRGPKGERLYRCRARHASGPCPSPTSIMADVIDDHVQGLVLAEIDGVARLVPDNAEREQAAEALDSARADLDIFRGDRGARRKLGAGAWHDWLDDYLRAVRDAEAELDRLDGRAGAATSGLTRDHYLALPVDERREVLGGFIDTVIVRRSVGKGRNVEPVDTRSRVLWRGEAPADLPRPRISSPIVPFDFEDHVEAGVSAAQHSA